MRKDLYKEMYLLEGSYWWHVAKRMLVKQLINKYISAFDKKTFVDVGCGTGKFLEEMNKWQNWGELKGLDGSKEALKFTKERQIADVKLANFEKKLPLKDNSVDVITSLDVVEHIDKDQHLVTEFYRVLKPGGIAVITVPAHQWLWTYWDEMLRHFRRHNKQSVTKLCNNANLKIETLSYFYSYLLPVAILIRWLKSNNSDSKASSDFIKVPWFVNQMLLVAAWIETKILVTLGIPFGLSVVCVARKEE